MLTHTFNMMQLTFTVLTGHAQHGVTVLVRTRLACVRVTDIHFIDRNTFSMVSLTLHETIPGHHLQVSTTDSWSAFYGTGIPGYALVHVLQNGYILLCVLHNVYTLVCMLQRVYNLVCVCVCVCC